jgi:hypothetical protein
MFVDFKKVKETVTIEQTAVLLGRQLRAACPACKDKVETAQKGLFYGFPGKSEAP